MGKVLLICLSITFILDCIIWYLSEHSINTMPFFHGHAYFEFFFLSFIFFKISSPTRSRLILMLVLIFAIISIINTVIYEPFNQFNSNQRFVECIILSFIFITFLTDKYDPENNKNNRFLGASLLLYFLGTLMVFILSKELFLGPKVNYLWIIHSIMNIILNISFAVFLYRNSKLIHS